MKKLFQELSISLRLTLLLAVVLCGLYPLVVFVMGQVIFPKQANGSLLYAKDGSLLGSELIAQNFSSSRFFHPRPSAAGTGWDAANSSGSNLGPTSKALADTIKQRVADYRKENNLPENASIPADAVTTSGSGLDPHISPANASLQLPRVARERHLDEARLKALVDQCTDQPDWRVFGETRVNVVKLNLAMENP
jgi:potassium-transporting ATPase KdpC subunit